MKKFLLLAAVVTLSWVSGFAQGGKVIEDKNAQKRDVKGFHAIRISSGIDLYLNQSGNEAVAVSASRREDVAKIQTEVVDGVLIIHLENNNWLWGTHGNRALKAYVSCKSLDGIKASGGSDVYFGDVLKADKLELGLSGGSDLRGSVQAQTLVLQQSGGSDSYLSGTVNQFSVHAAGGSDVHGYDLQTNECHIEASGGSDVHITVQKELSVSAAGGSDVTYRGSAVIRDKHTSGSSSVTKKG